ncbi:MAG TPA: DNA-binding response regulator [Desulfobacter sp.]|uniref:response regulator n=1 Tax=Desulfobacter sp. UBA2225 TaxID=1961413 RepID=UPI000E9E9115|nr:response regulator transcription factor [Desulfobacter sp. UBA2225]HAR33432.1 DNA-binding response regulator [Desulfobacter sp.]
MKINIILADDHHVIREGLRLLLERETDLLVLAEADTGRAALSAVKKFNPDLVIMDVSMPELNGMEATRKILSEAPATKVLALSMYSDRRFVEGMFQAGVSGYILKNCIARELVSAIRLVAKGQVYISPEIAGTIVDGYLSRLVPQTDTIHRLQRKTLTDREREILQLISEGQNSKEVAETLHVSPKTVDAHRRNIMEKVGVHSIAELTKFAIREGITTL